MAEMDTSDVVPVAMPQANVNDEEVTLVNWCVADGSRATAGEPLCEVETSKAVGEMPAPVSGVLKHAAHVGDVVAVGQVFAYVGPSAEAIEVYLAARQSEAAREAKVKGVSSIEVTAGAAELARRYGIDASGVPAKGKVRRSDIERFIAERGLTETTVELAVSPPVGEALPSALVDRVASEGDLHQHQWAVARHLQRSQSQLAVAHVVMDVSMQEAARWIESRRQAGVMTGPIPILLRATAEAIRLEPKLASFRLGRRVYRYRAVDIAYTARSADGRLFTPVVRGVDSRSLDEITAECGRLNMAVFRGQLASEDMTGACITVSLLNDQPVRFHVGLQNAYQSAILTAGAVRDEVRLIDAKPAAVATMTLTLSYDHGLMDGWEAGAALQAARDGIASVQA